MMFQLAVAAVLFLFLIIRKRGKIRLEGGPFYDFALALLPFLAVFSLIGYINGHQTVQIFVDGYKYLEIILYYFLLRLSWRDNEELLKGVRSLEIFMLTVGTAEIFLTARGGTGLNLIMSLFPIAFMLSLDHYLPGTKVLLGLSMLIVASCQTRTYIVGFLLGFLVLVLLLPTAKRKTVVTWAFLGIAAGAAVIGLSGARILGTTLERFGELTTGFEESGGYRIYEYREAIHRFREQPLFGHGFGYLRRTFIQKMGWMDWGGFVHCLYLEILFKTGICGMLYLSVIVVKFMRRIWQEMKECRNRNRFLFDVCCGSFCAFLIWAFTYTFAPLSTVGSMFLGPEIGILAIQYGEGHRKRR